MVRPKYSRIRGPNCIAKLYKESSTSMFGSEAWSKAEAIEPWGMKRVPQNALNVAGVKSKQAALWSKRN